MSKYRTIKELVINTCLDEGVFPSYEKLTSLVLTHFPSSKWQESHYAWYKSQIKRGHIPVPGFGDDAPDGSGGDDPESEIQETIDVSVSLERDLHSYLALKIDAIETGLVLMENGIEHQTDAGRIDLLATNAASHTVVIELKAGKAKDNALGQLLGYMGCIGTTSGESTNVRGILVASDFEPRVIYAAKGLPSIKLVKYRVAFEFQEVT